MNADKLLFSQETVEKFVNNIYTVSGMHVGLHDIRRNHCQAAAGDGVQNLCTVCQNRCAEFLEQCRQCDSRHLEEVQKTKQTLIYTCHLGLTEVIIPIVDDNTVKGVLFLGKVRISDRPRTAFSGLAEHLTERYPQSFPAEDREFLLTAYENTASVTEEKLLATVELARTSIQGIYLNRWLRNQEFTTQQRFQRYFEDYDFLHLPLSELSAKQAAEDLNISYSQLNRISAEVTGLPFKQYVLHLKLEAAADMLLTNPSKKISDIAASVGFDDVHYFSRIFRKKTGESSMEYRKNRVKKT